MKSFLMALLIGLPYFAQADGWVCTNKNEDLRVRAYNHTDPNEGTRSIAVVVVSNPSLKENRTLARFESKDGVVSSTEGAVFTARVDLRNKGVKDNGERTLGGAKVNNIRTIVLDVDFLYNQPINDGEKADGVVVINKRNGESSSTDVTCVRYLKTDPTAKESCD